jgi:hypothetical protein
MTRQYVAVEFKPGGRQYTYHNDGEAVAIGDLIHVEMRGGRKVVTVAGLSIEEPKFETKPIIGKHHEMENEDAR